MFRSLLPQFGLFLAASAISFGVWMIPLGIALSGIGGWGALASLFASGAGALSIIAGLYLVSWSWPNASTLVRVGFFITTFALIIVGGPFAPDRQSAKDMKYPKEWASLGRGWFADYKESDECPDITGIYRVSGDRALRDTFFGRTRKGRYSDFDDANHVAGEWDVMKVSGDVNSSLSITILKDRKYHALGEASKTYTRKKGLEYRCMTGWVYSYTDHERSRVYFAKDEEGFLVAKSINRKTDRTGWLHWGPVSTEHYQAVQASKVLPKEPAKKPRIAKYIDRPATKEPTLQMPTALTEDVRLKLMALQPPDINIVGVRHDKSRLMVKALADSNKTISTLMKNIEKSYPSSLPELRTIRQNSSTVYAEIMVAKDAF